MRIHFFEEYPTDECLSLAQDIDFPATVFLAATELQAYEEVAARLLRWNPRLKAAYWPLLRRSYWISPFAHTDEIHGLRDELQAMRQTTETEPHEVLLDLELPLIRWRLFWQNALRFRTTKAAIETLLHDAHEPGVSLLTAEYPVPYGWSEWLLQRLGVSYPQALFPHTPIAMLYTSIVPRRRWAEWLGHRLLGRQQQQRLLLNDPTRRFFVGLGTIATGVFGNEPILSPDALALDLALCQRYGVSDVVIFRLGGLTPQYLDVIRRFQTTW